MRTACRCATAALSLATLLGCGGSIAAQSSPTAHAAGKVRGATLYQSFEGSSNSVGTIMQMTTSLGYNFNEYFGVDAGVPVYFIRPPSSIPERNSATGLGNLFVRLRLTLDNPTLNFSSRLMGTVPTGSTATGLSTGRVTFDWNNRFDREFGRWIPFAEAGIGSTVIDTTLFRRPFTTLGRVAPFEVGTSYNVWRWLDATASAYAVMPWGPQRVFSRFVLRQAGDGTTATTDLSRLLAGDLLRRRLLLLRRRRLSEPSRGTVISEIVGGADLVRDNGFSVSLGASPTRVTDLWIGYTRSTHLLLNTVSFGMGFNLSALFARATPH